MCPTNADFNVIDASDDAGWMDVLSRSVQHDFHHLPGYHRLAEQQDEGTAYLFAYREGEYTIGVPLLLRPVDQVGHPGLLDATSVYGYAGPIASHPNMPDRVIGDFQDALRRELVRRQVISVFSRLHPLIRQADLLDGLGEVRRVGVTVSVDLTIPAEAQWAGYSKQCRRIIRRARDAGVTCVHDHDRVYRREWAAMYRETMQRVSAPSSYYFDAPYFERLAEELGPALQLFVALFEDQVIAAGLFTKCDGIVQAHLAALRRDYMHLSPARLVDDTARTWAYESGAHTFHLGGGVGGRDDSLLLYKSGFSDRRHAFAVWQWIVDGEAYEHLRQERLRQAPDSDADPDAAAFFPAYRRPTPTSVARHEFVE